MAEYIEREALIKHLKNNADYKRECGYEQNIDIESLISYLEKIPSADVVKVVRCKDCANGCHKTDKTVVCKILNKLMITEDYCSYGAPEEREG